MDLVRLAIVYDTAQAAARVTDLNSRLQKLGATGARTQVVFKGAGERWATTGEIMASMATTAKKAGESLASPTARAFSLSEAMGRVNTVTTVSSARLRNVALAGLRLSAGLASGHLSAMSLASAMSRLAGAAVVGAVAISVVNVVNALKEFKRISEDVSNTIDAMQSSARDARADVARLLGEAPAESPAERAIRRLRDAAAQMRREAARVGGPAGKLLSDQAAALEAEVHGIGQRAANQKAREANKPFQEYLRNMERQDAILTLLGAGPLERLNVALDIQRKEMIRLVEEGYAPNSQRVRELAETIAIGTQRMAEMQRQANLMRGVLSTAADTLEQFVIEGTAAFSDFLNNILRLLYRDAVSDIIGSVLPKIAPGGGDPTGGATEVMGDIGGGVTGQVVTQVTFNVQTPDAQSTAQWLERNGDRIAGIVAGRAARSRALRGKLTRG